MQEDLTVSQILCFSVFLDTSSLYGVKIGCPQGLPCPPWQEPYRTLAELGSAALIKQGGAALSDCVPQLILPLKTAIRGRRLRAVLSALCALRALAVSCPKTGRLILGFHRHLLPAMNQYVLVGGRRLQLGGSVRRWPSGGALQQNSGPGQPSGQCFTAKMRARPTRPAGTSCGRPERARQAQRKAARAPRPCTMLCWRRCACWMPRGGSRPCAPSSISFPPTTASDSAAVVMLTSRTCTVIERNDAHCNCRARPPGPCRPPMPAAAAAPSAPRGSEAGQRLDQDLVPLPDGLLLRHRPCQCCHLCTREGSDGTVRASMATRISRSGEAHTPTTTTQPIPGPPRRVAPVASKLGC